jgi:hypothetical protein
VHLIEPQKEEVQQEFGRRRRNQLLLTGAYTPILVGVLLYRKGLADTILGVRPQLAVPVFLVLVVGAALFSLRN